MACFIYINGKEFPSPDRGLEFLVATFVSSGKNANGEFVGQRVGRDQYKLNNLVWNKLDASTWSAMLKEFQEFVVTVKFPDMVNNDWLTLRMYPGDRTAQPLQVGADGLPTMYSQCKVNIVDCGELD
ncbi:hypothetical protein DW757_06115 [Clostridium sp. AM29-11AC]|uniref:hypothetical protein n=1 Tax=Clostridium sp. AM29-11AC TaxID=2293028 RepID=UPI000E506223|nr:hypothetical protein [Clostridium sp. AM29-11AC]RHT57988.1 hypothetical protein DW757_06115 [Clostridium sp. AM29-11AC]